MGWRRILLYAGIAVVVLLVVIQFIPYGERSNPDVVSGPAWTDPDAQKLVEDACYDCHSNETNWPWYARLAPASWLLYNDVDGGRQHLNFSDFERFRTMKGEAIETVQEGEMPPIQYKLMHRSAWLSDAERQQIVDEFNQIF